MMANHYDVILRIKLLVRARWNITHGHQLCSGHVRCFKLPRLANVEQHELLALIEPDLHFFGRNLVVHVCHAVDSGYFPIHFGSRFSANARMPSCASDVFINSSR